jgi:NADH:ubiquinone oxidoreductase subunit E
MAVKKSLYLCMGSACHQSGGSKLIPRIESLIREHGLEERLELKGAFCLDRCGAGGTLELEGRVMTGIVGADLGEIFRTEIVPRLTGE